MKIIPTILLLFFCFCCSAQELPTKTQEQVENQAEVNEEVFEDDQLLQELEYYTRHPLDINLATESDLQSLRLLNDLQIHYLVQYRQHLGKFIALQELQAVPGMDMITIRKLLPFVIAGPTLNIKESFLSRFKGEQSLLFRVSRVLEKSKGYLQKDGNRYLGDRNQLLFRYRYQYKDLLYLGGLGEKDAGEPFFKGRQAKGFDFYSFHFFVKKLGILQSLAIGDYRINLGQGLILWQGPGFGKSSEVSSIKRQGSIIQPYRSADEFNFNRGIAFSLEKRKVQASLFFSRRQYSGNLVFDSIQFFSSWQTSGNHRTFSENEDRNRIGVSSMGGRLQYRSNNGVVGFNAVSYHFSLPLKKQDKPYNFYAISGKSWSNESLDYSFTYRNLHFFGEAALDKRMNSAFMNGLLLSADPKLDISLLYRNLDPAYQALWANAFTESSSPTNEKGIYLGFILRPVYRWTVNAYADLYCFPWLKYRVDAPSSGRDYLFQLVFTPDKKSSLSIRYRTQKKQINGTEGSIPYLQEQVKQNLRFQFSRESTAGLSLKSRVEICWLKKEAGKEEGFLGYLEASGKAGQKLRLNSRLQYYETGGYDSRIYAYERDVLYAFSIPANFEKGLRYYINVSYEIFSQLSCWVRIGQTLKRDKHNLGSGLDEIKGNKKTDLRIQLLYRF